MCLYLVGHSINLMIYLFTNMDALYIYFFFQQLAYTSKFPSIFFISPLCLYNTKSVQYT